MNLDRKILATIIFSLVLIGHSFFSKAQEADKFVHFGVSAVLSGGAETFLHYKTEMHPAGHIILATLVGAAPGFAKEVYDMKSGNEQFNKKDMIANSLGCITGAFGAHFINNGIQARIERKQQGQYTLVITCQF